MKSITKLLIASLFFIVPLQNLAFADGGCPVCEPTCQPAPNSPTEDVSDDDEDEEETLIIEEQSAEANS